MLPFKRGFTVGFLSIASFQEREKERGRQRETPRETDRDTETRKEKKCVKCVCIEMFLNQYLYRPIQTHILLPLL